VGLEEVARKQLKKPHLAIKKTHYKKNISVWKFMNGKSVSLTTFQLFEYFRIQNFRGANGDWSLSSNFYWSELFQNM